MPLYLFFLLSFVLGSACASPEGELAEPSKRDALAHVDVFMGSGGYAYGYGAAFPGAAAPNGLAKVGPDTSGRFGSANFLHYSGYWYDDDTVNAFGHLHLHGTGATDYGILGVMPVNGFKPAMRKASGRASTFDKSKEVGEPGYYATSLEQSRVRAEITATTHAAHHRWTWAKDAKPWVVVDLDHHLAGGEVKFAELRLEPESRRARGRLHHIGGMSSRFGGYEVFFELRTRQQWKSWQIWGEDELKDGAVGAEAEGSSVGDARAASGQEVGFAFELALAPGEAGEMQIGLSLVDVQGAARHLSEELPEWEFEKTRAETLAAWEKRLKVVRVYGGEDDDVRTFYSGLRHTFMMPSRVGDSDGRFRYEGSLHDTGGTWVFLNDFSLWDTYRTLHPLYSLIAPDLATDSARSLSAMAKGAGFFPVWPLATGDGDVMIGASSDIVIADSYLKGIRDFDVEAAWSILRAAALDENAPKAGRGGRNGMREYRELGWLPAESSSRSVSVTTEYAHNDFALANLAAALGHSADEKLLRERSRKYRELFDPETQFLRAKNRDGSFVGQDEGEGEFDPFSWEHYAEANAWHSLWMAAHDIEGFAALFGGKKAMVKKLEEFFELAIEENAEINWDSDDALLLGNMPRKYYWPANEPDIHAVYMFAQAGRPDLTQKYLPWIRNTFYSPAPNGLPGNDDGGTMSAWFIFSALGFYPLPGSTDYIIGAPIFPKVELEIQGGVFTIEAQTLSPDHIYVESVSLNDKVLKKPVFQHDDLKPGGKLVFTMSNRPSKWGH